MDATAYNRLNRWRKVAVWDRIMDTISDAYDGDIQMIDTSLVRVHQYAAGRPLDNLLLNYWLASRGALNPNQLRLAIQNKMNGLFARSAMA